MTRCLFRSLVVPVLFVTVLLVLLASSAVPIRAASAWYVAPGGSDTSACQSPAAPCATINGALSKPGFEAGDTIQIATGVYTGSGNEVVLLDKDAALTGGWNVAFTVQNGMSTIDGQSTRRGVTVTDGRSVTIERFMIQNGSSVLGGGIYNNGSMLIVNHSAIIGNRGSSGGGIYNENLRTMILNTSVINDNTATMSGGGGIYNYYYSTLIINNSIVSGNTGLGGGGIHNGPFSVLKLHSSTLSHNRATQFGGGGVTNGGTITMQNTLIANNTAVGGSPDCSFSSGVNSLGYNLIGNITGCTFTSAAGDLTNVDAKLDPTESMGFHALLLGSPAINAGNPAGCTDSLGNSLASDQRGLPRVGRCDIGAVEAQAIEPSIKTADKSIVSPGETATYTITIPNISTTNVQNVFVTDAIPSSLLYQLNSLNATSGSWGYSAGTITWTGTVSAAMAVTITFNAKVDNRVQGNALITNTALISGGGISFSRGATFKTSLRWAYLPVILRNYCGPLFADDFKDPNSGWPVGDSSSIRYEYIVPGPMEYAYRILVKSANWWAGARPGFKATDYMISVNLRNATGIYGSYGIAFGISDDWSQLYSFEIDSGGYYSIFRYGSGKWTSLARGQSNSIRPGTASNIIRVVRSGSSISVYANGQLLTSIADGTYVGMRHIGLLVSSYDQPTVDVYFEDFKAYSASCSLTAGLGQGGVLPGAAVNHVRAMSGQHSGPNDKHVLGWEKPY